jgi:hypothetical protein
VLRLVDLPDGTFLGVADCASHCIVRLQASKLIAPDQLEPAVDEVTGLPRQRPDGSPFRPFPSSEHSRDVPVVARSLAELLSRALASSGSTDLPVLGTLWDELPDWAKR